MNPTPGLQLDSVSHAAGRFRLGPLSLHIPAHAWFVLLGPSGSGKTTLLRLIAGVIPAPPGAIRLDGRDIGPLPPEARGVAYVSQHGDLFPHLTVADNLAFGLQFKRFSRAERGARVVRLLDLFGIRHLADRSASTVSGGEGRRVAVARALAQEPALLLLDEPLGMLDPNGRAELQSCLAQVHRELGTATVHVTHDRDEAWVMGSRCGVLLDGRLVQEGPVESVFRRPASRAAARFLGASNILPAPALGGPANRWAMLRPEHIAITSPDNPGARPARVAAIRDRGGLCDVEAAPEDGAPPLLIHAAWRQGSALSPGGRIGLRWRPEDVLVWEDETAADAAAGGTHAPRRDASGEPTFTTNR